MKVVMTLVARDEADILDEHLRYHLDSGVDFVVATDHRSVDGTTDILREHERAGHLRLIRRHEEGFAQSAWVTEMARSAAVDHAADWVINSDADEFWWSHHGTLREVLAAVPREFGAVRGIWRNFVLRPESVEPFYERMTIRRRPSPDLADPYAAHVKVAHRGDADVIVVQGNHDARGIGLRLIREWFPFEILHFPIRSRAQLERKYSSDVYLRGRKGRVPQHTAAMEARILEDADAAYRQLLVDDADRERGIVQRTLTRDTRLRDVLRGHATPLPTFDDGIDLANDVATFLETDAARRLFARTDKVERRLECLERASLTHLLRTKLPGP
jgi:hypothetical protein